MSGAHNLAVVITGNTTSLKGALTTAGRDVQKFEKQVENSGKSGAKAGSLLKNGLATGIVAVGIGIAYSIGQAVAFDKELRNIQSITKDTDAEIAQVGKTLVGMSTQLPQSAKTLAAGLYDIASSGFQGAEGLKVLEAAAISASAGLTTTEVSAKAITSVLNAYGLEAGAATDVSDILFQAVNVGVVTFEELSGTIGDVVGTAAAATVGIDEVSSAIATMTLSGISASEAGTSLNRLIQGLIDPSDDLALALHDIGYESGAAALETDSLSNVILKLMDASKGNIETLLKWFPEIRAARGALALMSAEGKNYLEVVAAIEIEENRRNAAQKALTEQMKSVSAQWTIFTNNINAAAITVGLALLPSILQLLDAIKELAGSGMDILSQAMERLGPFFDSVVAYAENLWKIFGDLLEVAGPLAGAIAGLIGVAAIEALNLYAKAWELASGFLADHPLLVQAVGVALLTYLVPGLVAAAASHAAGAASAIIWGAAVFGSTVIAGIATAVSSIQGMVVSLSVLQTSMIAGQGIASAFRGALASLGSLGVAAAVVAVTMAVKTFNDEMAGAKEQASEWVEGFTGNFNPARATLKQLEAEINKNEQAAKDWETAANKAWNPFKKGSSDKARDELRNVNEGYIELRDTAKMLQTEMDITASRALELARSEDFMSASVDAATGEFDAQAAAALEELDALSQLQDQLRAMFDPLWAAQDAQMKLAEAQQAVTDAVAANSDANADNNVSQEEMNQLQLDAVKAAQDYQGSLIGLKAAVADGSVSIDDAKLTMQEWVTQGLITKEQARLAGLEFDTLGGKAEALPTSVVMTVSANTEAAGAKLDALAAKMYALTANPQKTGVDMSSGFQIGGTPTSPNQRWGGIVHAYAGGGIHAHVARRQVIRYAEPETGGEAFVPRRGSPSRSTAVLREAAGWYGYGLTKMATGGILSFAAGGIASGGGSWGQTIVDLRGATIYGIDDLNRTIERAVDKAHDKTATKLRKKATY